MEFSEKLKTIRTQANFTQNELAEKLAISRQAISNYEHGFTQILPTYNLRMIVNFFNESYNY